MDARPSKKRRVDSGIAVSTSAARDTKDLWANQKLLDPELSSPEEWVKSLSGSSTFEIPQHVVEERTCDAIDARSPDGTMSQHWFDFPPTNVQYETLRYQAPLGQQQFSDWQGQESLFPLDNNHHEIQCLGKFDGYDVISDCVDKGPTSISTFQDLQNVCQYQGYNRPKDAFSLWPEEAQSCLPDLQLLENPWDASDASEWPNLSVFPEPEGDSHAVDHPDSLRKNHSSDWNLLFDFSPAPKPPGPYNFQGSCNYQQVSGLAYTSTASRSTRLHEVPSQQGLRSLRESCGHQKASKRAKASWASHRQCPKFDELPTCPLNKTPVWEPKAAYWHLQAPFDPLKQEQHPGWILEALPDGRKPDTSYPDMYFANMVLEQYADGRPIPSELRKSHWRPLDKDRNCLA